DQIWAPIEKNLPPETKRVIISPDGDLSFVSFATMLEADDKFVGQKYSIRYVASGRDLLQQFKAGNNSPTDVYANPDFGAKSPSTYPDRATTFAFRSTDMRDLENISLIALPGTETEANALQKRLG